MKTDIPEDFKFIDVHSHLLPRVDDGSESVEQSVSLMNKLAEIGVSDVILTPHYSQRKGFTVPKEEICESFRVFVENCKCETDLKLYLGNEIEFSYDAYELIRDNRLLTLANTKYILIEFYPLVSYGDFEAAVQNVIGTGHRPVIAHVERYVNLGDKLDKLEALKDKGVTYQINLPSFASTSGSLKKRLKKIVKHRLADYVGNDTHHSVLERQDAYRFINRIIKAAGEEYARAIFYGNAKKIIEGK